MTHPGDAWSQLRHQYHCLHKKESGPSDRAKGVTYGLITCLIRPEKIDEPNRTRLVAGGYRVHYPGDAGTPTANLLTIKLLLNSIISTPNAKFMTMGIKDFYLNTPMAWYEYMQLQLAGMPEDVIAHYKLTDIATPEGCINRSKRECTAYHRPGSLPRNFSKNAYKRTVAIGAKPHQACGHTILTRSASTSSLQMIM